MIKIRIRNDDHEIDLQFPISENKLYAKLAEIHAIEGKDAPQSAFVTEVYWPEELSMLKDRFANLDELNYLARRMESFDYHEYDQFLIGITKLENPTEKDLINLTFNLDHFTLCKDVSSYGKIGREYVMNTEGAVPAHDEDDPKYAAIGKALIDRGLAQITAKGLLIYPPGTRIMLLGMGNDPNPVESGTRGTVRVVDDIGTLHCDFDNGRSLGVVPGEDSFRKLTDEELAEEQYVDMDEDESGPVMGM